ncbi:hypothetical protein DRQ21_09335 [Candidatus Fermentibacteria bacterium]|nr:MAG: hypothetical protein DRQ21_09335 [Candidatus Fermentibacteria bacterium]
MGRLLVLCVVVSGVLFTASAEWIVEEISQTGTGDGQTAAISLGSTDLPRIAFGDPGTGAKYIKKNTGSGWTTENIYLAYYGNCEYFDMVTDENDISHVSFSRIGDLYYAEQDSSSADWNVEYFYQSYGLWNSIGLNSIGYPGISCQTYTDHTLHYTFWNGSSWAFESINSGVDAGSYNSLATEGVNKAHIAYSIYSPVHGLKYATRDESGVWSTSYVDTSMTAEPVGVSLVLNSNNYPSISYTTTNELRYASWNGSSWSVETVLSIATDDTKETGQNAYGTSLVLDQWDCPHIAHCSLNGDSLLYSWNNGTGWQTESICPLGYPDEYGDPDMVLDSQNRPHIVFYRQRLVYAFNDEDVSVEHSSAALEPIVFNTSVNPFYGSLNLTFNLPEPSHVNLTVYDLQGRTVNDLLSDFTPQGDHIVNWTPEQSVPPGEYIIRLNTMNRTFSRKVVYLH